MTGSTTIQIFPAFEGEWAVRADHCQSFSMHATRDLAVEKARELIGARVSAGVTEPAPGGSTKPRTPISTITITIEEEEFDAEEEDAMRREALRIMPSRAELDALIARLPPSTIDYSMEDDELPC